VSGVNAIAEAIQLKPSLRYCDLRANEVRAACCV
jgi:hypothetical protein